MAKLKLVPGKLYKARRTSHYVCFHKKGEGIRGDYIINHRFVLYLGPQYNEEKEKMEYCFLNKNGETLALWDNSHLLYHFKMIKQVSDLED